MTSREHFEVWMKLTKPNMPLDWNEQEGYYYHDIVNLMFAAWNEASAEVDRLRAELERASARGDELLFENARLAGRLMKYEEPEKHAKYCAALINKKPAEAG